MIIHNPINLLIWIIITLLAIPYIIILCTEPDEIGIGLLLFDLIFIFGLGTAALLYWEIL